MAAKHLSIPNDLKSVRLTLGVDTLDITVTADCSWCYSPNPTPCFNPPPAGFLAAGSYTATSPHTTYGPFSPIAKGTVNINAVTSGTCNPSGDTETAHTIVVS